MNTYTGHDRLEISFLDVDDASRHAVLVGGAEPGVLALHPRDGSLEGSATDVAGGIEVEGGALAIHLWYVVSDTRY